MQVDLLPQFCISDDLRSLGLQPLTPAYTTPFLGKNTKNNDLFP